MRQRCRWAFQESKRDFRLVISFIHQVGHSSMMVAGVSNSTANEQYFSSPSLLDGFFTTLIEWRDAPMVLLLGPSSPSLLVAVWLGCAPSHLFSPNLPPDSRRFGQSSRQRLARIRPQSLNRLMSSLLGPRQNFTLCATTGSTCSLFPHAHR